MLGVGVHLILSGNVKLVVLRYWILLSLLEEVAQVALIALTIMLGGGIQIVGIGAISSLEEATTGLIQLFQGLAEDLLGWSSCGIYRLIQEVLLVGEVARHSLVSLFMGVLALIKLLDVCIEVMGNNRLGLR